MPHCQKLSLCGSDVEKCRVNVTCNECDNVFELKCQVRNEVCIIAGGRTFLSGFFFFPCALNCKRLFRLLFYQTVVVVIVHRHGAGEREVPAVLGAGKTGSLNQ